MLPLILYESTFRWAVSWRRALRNAGLTCPITETRALAACGEALALQPAAVVGIEVKAANLANVLPQVVLWSRQFPLAVILLLGNREMQEVEWELRDAWAHGVLLSRRDVPRWLSLVAGLTPPTVPDREKSPDELVVWPW